MSHFKKEQEYEEPHNHERFLIFLSFLTGALAGYILTNYVALFGA